MFKNIKKVSTWLTLLIISVFVFITGCTNEEINGLTATFDTSGVQTDVSLAENLHFLDDRESDIQTDEKNNSQLSDLPNGYYSVDVLAELENTENYKKSTIEHIFLGTINKKGNATGYHYEMIEGSPGHIIEGTESEPNEFGVYSAKVIVDDTKKESNGGYSSFFPKSFSPQEVIDAINEAYSNAELIPGSDYIYQGVADSGLEISIYEDDSGKITSAFPTYTRKK